MLQAGGGDPGVGEGGGRGFRVGRQLPLLILENMVPIVRVLPILSRQCSGRILLKFISRPTGEGAQRGAKILMGSPHPYLSTRPKRNTNLLSPYVTYSRNKKNYFYTKLTSSVLLI